MPVPTANDIAIVLSGGETNIDPNASIGGIPSTTPLQDNIIDNLFGDVAPTDATNGLTDYRCFYVFNDASAALYNIQLYVNGIATGGSAIQLGVDQSDEIQRLTVSGVTPSV